jgi:hypothetical protein
MKIDLDKTSFKIEFRHRRALHAAGLSAITTCVLIATGPDWPRGLIAIDNAVCSWADIFSRREGRCRALRRLLNGCGPLKPFREDIWIVYQYGTRRVGFQTMVDEKSVLLIPRIFRPEPRPISAEERAQRIAAGEPVRQARQKARAAS